MLEACGARLVHRWHRTMASRLCACSHSVFCMTHIHTHTHKTHKHTHRCGTEITRYSPDGVDTDKDSVLLAVHLSPEGAAALNAHGQSGEVAPALPTHAVPHELLKLLDSGECTFHTGLRRGSAHCRAPEDKTFHLSKKEKRTSIVNKAHCIAQELRNGKAAAAGAVASAAGAVALRRPLFRFCELFAGIGGFRLGLEPLGGVCSFASEIEPEARQVYVANFGGEPPAGNILDIPNQDIPHFDLLTAGFPCQSWTETGDVGGFADPRGVLFYEISRLLHAKKPAGFLLENVPNLAKVGDGSALALILQELRGAGYTTRHRIINCRPLVPQRRLRLYIVGFRDAQTASKFEWPGWVLCGDLDASEREAAPGSPRPTEAARGWRTVSSILEPICISSSSSSSSSGALMIACNSSARELAHELCASKSPAHAARRRQGAHSGPASPRAMPGNDTHPPLPLSASPRARADGRWHSYALSQLQWQNVCDAEARNVLRPNSIWRRLVNPRSAARTLIGTYRTGFMRHSQFVAADVSVSVGDGGGGGQERGSTREQMLAKKTDHDCGASHVSSSSYDMHVSSSSYDMHVSDHDCGASHGASQGSSAPAPRFFTQRECCRLMGFPEWYESTSAFSGMKTQKGMPVSVGLFCLYTRSLLTLVG